MAACGTSAQTNRSETTKSVRRRLHGLFAVEPGGEDLVLDLNQLERLPGDLFGFRGHAGDVVADVADLVHGEGSLVVPDGEDGVLVRELAPGHDRPPAPEPLPARGGERG